MKTLSRTLTILVVFAALSMLMVVGVNASGVSASSFPRERSEFRPGSDNDGAGFVRPEGFEENHFERGERGERGGGGFTGLMFGAVKNTFIIALLVTLIVVPRSIARNKRKSSTLKPALTE